MSDVELNHLIKMLNQIADNLAQGEEGDVVAERVADHVRRFWPPAMRKAVSAYGAEDGSSLTAVSLRAIAILGKGDPGA